ncbi:hypothetical protein CFP75_41345 [Amycolatopsis alba DSM 44262]|uniref:Uncharacterized protein n=3 Tax=Amycolatopsis alba TaxID=76020 RepID=A0A229R7Z5_AMYAL|nr:hypothetical protein CFP75_41345 [Amycolatopsis alba DSM 44262]
MLAMSKPLNLWAPSGARFFTPGFCLTAKEFVTYVEEGYVRVLGREPWLLDPSFRGSERWPESKWFAEFDGPIKRICEEDQHLPPGERRVLACPPEKGWDWADEYLAKKPEDSDRWSRLSKVRNGHMLIPSQIRDRALAYGGDNYLAARQILRDAHNHGQALVDSGAEVPFLLSETDVKYLNVIATTPCASNAIPVFTRTASDNPTKSMTAITAQLVELLQVLDIHAPSNGEGRRLSKFVHGEGHKLLVSWISSVCRLMRDTNPRAIDGTILNLLRDDLGRAEMTRPINELIRRKDEGAVGLVGMVSMIAGLITDPIGVATIGGVLAQVYPVGKGLSRQLGYAPANFTGEQWPFLYTYSRRANRKSLKRMRHLLDQISDTSTR